ncbi:hypothetical protein DFJ73DRAFT_175614 [Zopfochytrium polystomum]|nr:hypothetical protein DFJ73DRAFT_175614 [Zopfochytrium polystomum]
MEFPQKLLMTFAATIRLLDSRDVYVQTRSYQMLAGLTALNVQRNSVQIEMDSSASFLMSSALMESLEKDFGDFDFDEYRHQDCVRALGYILSWLVAADHLKDATYQLKSDYTNQIREHKSVFDNVLLFIFHVLGVGYQDVTPFDLSKWDVTEFHIEALDISERNGFSLLCGHLYWRLLQTFPGLSRSWWSNSKNRQLTKAVETYTERYFSPLLAKWETQAVTVADLSAFDEMAVKVPKTASEIAASYQIDEAKLEITLRFPSAYPLRQIDVDSPTGGRVAGVQESQWRAWMLSTGIIAQNASILDALKVWHKNIKLHFEGLEECAICYSVVGVIDRSLPNKSCKTCKNKFHASCLFKWIRTSGNTQCPLCRTEM